MQGVFAVNGLHERIVLSWAYISEAFWTFIKPILKL